MWADGDLAFDAGIVAGFSIWRSMADSEELTAEGDFVAASAIGEKAIVADAVEAVRQSVQEEAADELLGIERHHFGFAILPIVFPSEPDLAIGQREQPAVGDGDAVRVTAEISQHLFGAAERRLGIDDPVGASELLKAPGECGGIGEVGEIAKEAQPARIKGVLQVLQE